MEKSTILQKTFNKFFFILYQELIKGICLISKAKKGVIPTKKNLKVLS